MVKPTPKKYSTYYSARAGVAILLVVFLLTGWGAYNKIINESNIVSIISIYMITAAAYFGINITRRTLEGINGVDGQTNSATPVLIPSDSTVVVPDTSKVVDSESGGG